MTLPHEMRAARLLGKECQYTFQTMPLPQPGPGELLIKVVAAGLCHTDLIMPMAEHGGPLPITGSHEPAGVVVGLGEGVDSFKEGDRVMAVNTARGCKQCANCKRYDQRWCPKAAMIGLRFMDGAFADYCLVTARYAAVIPDGMSFEQAATFSCAGVTVYAAIKRAGLKKRDFIAFSGLGALGGLGMEMAKCMGLKVVGLDARDGPVEAARKAKYPGDILVNPTKVPVEEVVKQVRAAREPGFDYGEGVDAVIMLNTSPAAVPYALSLLRPHGTIIFTAGPNNVSIPVLDFIWKDITAIGTQNGTAADMAEAAALCVQYGIKSTVRPYDFDETAMNRMVHDVEGREWSGKAVVRVDPEKWEV